MGEVDRPVIDLRQQSGAQADRRPASAFFEGLEARGQEPLLRRTTATIRFDLLEGDRTEHWYVKVDHGTMAVSRSSAAADAVIRIDKDMFERMAAGSVNAMAAALRGELVPEGDLSVLLRFQRIFPGPPQAVAAQDAAAGARA